MNIAKQEQKRIPIRILMAEDDPDDRLMVKEALAEARIINAIEFVNDGEELLDYLKRRGEFSYLKGEPYPGLILLDLNMPRKDGRDALMEIKSDTRLKHIPVVALTTTRSEEDITNLYACGINSYIIKPITFDALVEVMKALTSYWFEIVELPVA
jgi:CheY-like chemotaxis protein